MLDKLTPEIKRLLNTASLYLAVKIAWGLLLIILIIVYVVLMLQLLSEVRVFI